MATVLIVDDRSINREFLRSILTYLDHQTVEAANGVEGLKAVELHQPELIITDILMPLMDGYEFIRQLKKNESFKLLPIIIYTATYRKEEANLLANDLGVKYVISKPSDPEEMMNTIQRALDMPKMPRQSPFTSTCAKDMASTLYAAPLHLVMMEDKFKSSSTQLSSIKSFIQDNNKNELQNSTFVDSIDKFEREIQGYQKANKKLFSLIELTLDLISEKDERKLLQLFCHGARKAVDAEFAIAGIVDDQHRLVHVVTSGDFKDKINVETGQKINVDFINEILKQQSAYVCQNALLASIPWKLETVTEALCCPIVTSTKVYGFSYYVNKEENASFNEEDLRMIDTLSSEVSIFHENIEQFYLIQQQAAKLQIESAKLKEAKESLSKSELMFRQFAENINDVFWRITPTLDKVIYISPGYETIWGKSTDSIYQDPCSWQDEILEEDKSKVKTFIKQVVQTQEDGPIEYRIMRKDGVIRNIYNKTICLKDSQGTLTHIIGIATDITEYLQNQKALTVEEELGRILEKGENFNDIAAQILKLICKTFDWEIGELWIVDSSNDFIQHVDVWHKKKRSYALFDAASLNLKLSTKEDLAGTIWHRAKPHWISDYARNTTAERAHALNFHQLGAAIGFPLLYQENVLGVMNFISENISPISDDFHRILTTMGTRIGEFISQRTTQAQLLQLAKRGGYRVIF